MLVEMPRDLLLKRAMEEPASDTNREKMFLGHQMVLRCFSKVLLHHSRLSVSCRDLSPSQFMKGMTQLQPQARGLGKPSGFPVSRLSQGF